MTPSSGPTRWRQAALAVMVSHNDTMRALIGSRWRPPGWTRWNGEVIPKPEHTPAALRYTASVLHLEAYRLDSLARQCENRAVQIEGADHATS
jgi:hypothetical protein